MDDIRSARRREFEETMTQALTEAVRLSGGRLRLAFGERDDSPEENLEARHFLKFDERRAGLDIEAYGMTAELVLDYGPTLVEFLLDVLMQFRRDLPESYAAAAAIVREYGMRVFPVDKHDGWRGIF